MLLQTGQPECGSRSNGVDEHLQDASMCVLQDCAPAPGWTVHITKEGRLFYCNHVTRTANWLPPAEAWKSGEDMPTLPYGWERAFDDSGRPYFINHLNKTTTYETPLLKSAENPIPSPRKVSLERSATMGFGFVAGSEKPVIVRFVTEGGPSVDKLLPGDEILSVNGEDVKMAPREHVISLVRACSNRVELVVCQPNEPHGIRKSTLLSASKRARLKHKPSRVRFAESVCVNGAPLFPVCAFSLGESCVPPISNVLKVFLENGQTKSFKYDAWTTVQDVVSSLESKLCLQATEHFSLVVEHIKSLKRNKLTLLDPADTLARIASRPGVHKLRCLFRVAFVPPSAAALAQRDLHALDYLYTQCCNDVIQERFAPELQYDTALRLAALHIYQHALANNLPTTKLTAKQIERDVGLERFVPASLLDSMKRKEIRKMITHFLKLHASMAGPGKQLTALQTKLHYLDIVSQLPSYGAKCFSAGPRADAMERVILVSPKFGISQIIGSRSSMPIPVANIEDMRHLELRTDDHDELNRTVLIRLHNDKIICVTLEDRDAVELVLVLQGYYRIATNSALPLVVGHELAECDTMGSSQSIATMKCDSSKVDLAPPYLTQRHKVVADRWSYAMARGLQWMSFVEPPTYQPLNTRRTGKIINGMYNTLGAGGAATQYSDCCRLVNATQKLAPLTGNGTAGSVRPSTESTLKRVQELQHLVAHSERYNNERPISSDHCTDTTKDQTAELESDSDLDSIIAPIRHSDSLLLMNYALHNNHHLQQQQQQQEQHGMAPSSTSSSSLALVEMLRDDMAQVDQSNTTSCTTSAPANSISGSVNNELSFGVDTATSDNTLLLTQNSTSTSTPADIIDLRLLPPPATPDQLDGTLIHTSTTANATPPSLFADCGGGTDLEDFLARMVIPPPALQITPAVELTPEQIMTYIIPPPPKTPDLILGHENIVEYATISPHRKGGPLFSCCSGGAGASSSSNGQKADSATTNQDAKENCSYNIQPLPRRSSNEKIPDRPPKGELTAERQRSMSLTATTTTSMASRLVSPPSTTKSDLTAPHLWAPPQKPPLPPVPSLDVLRQKKNAPPPVPEFRTAGIGSPHLQRNRNLTADLEPSTAPISSKPSAISTPTSPHFGRGSYQLSTVPMAAAVIDGNDSVQEPSTTTVHSSAICTAATTKNLLTSQHHLHLNNVPSRSTLLSKTDNAMLSMLQRLDDIVKLCDAAQTQGGGACLNEDKFQQAKEQLTTHSLQLVSASKMLVIAMSGPDEDQRSLAEHLVICLTLLRQLAEFSQDMASYTTAPLQTRNLILKVRDVTAGFHQLITSDFDRSSQKAIEEHLTAQAEGLASVLSTLLRSLRVFSP